MIVEADPTVVKTKLAPVPDFIIVCTRTPMIVKNKSRPVEADPTVEKTLGTVLCSSHDGVPLKLKKENDTCQQKWAGLWGLQPSIHSGKY